MVVIKRSSKVTSSMECITFVDAQQDVKHAGVAATNRTSAVVVTVMEADLVVTNPMINRKCIMYDSSPCTI